MQNSRGLTDAQEPGDDVSGNRLDNVILGKTHWQICGVTVKKIVFLAY